MNLDKRVSYKVGNSFAQKVKILGSNLHHTFKNRTAKGASNSKPDVSQSPTFYYSEGFLASKQSAIFWVWQGVRNFTQRLLRGRGRDTCTQTRREERERERESFSINVFWGIMARGHLACHLWISVCILLVVRATCFYLPGVAPEDFQKVFQLFSPNFIHQPMSNDVRPFVMHVIVR